MTASADIELSVEKEIEATEAFLTEHGYIDALDRRYGYLTDVLPDQIWLASDRQPESKFDKINPGLNQSQPDFNIKDPVPITYSDFLEQILPTATAIRILGFSISAIMGFRVPLVSEPKLVRWDNQITPVTFGEGKEANAFTYDCTVDDVGLVSAIVNVPWHNDTSGFKETSGTGVVLIQDRWIHTGATGEALFKDYLIDELQPHGEIIQAYSLKTICKGDMSKAVWGIWVGPTTPPCIVSVVTESGTTTYEITPATKPS